MTNSDQRFGLFKVQLKPGLYGSEHRNPFLQQADGMVVQILENLGRGMFRTDFRVADTPETNNDYVYDGFLVVIPSKDGTWTE